MRGRMRGVLLSAVAVRKCIINSAVRDLERPHKNWGGVGRGGWVLELSLGTRTEFKGETEGRHQCLRTA